MEMTLTLLASDADEWKHGWWPVWPLLWLAPALERGAPAERGGPGKGHPRRAVRARGDHG